MNALISLIFMKKLTRGNSKKFKRNFKKKNATSILIFKNLYLMIYIIFEFIFKSTYLAIAPKRVSAKRVVKPKNVVSFEEYKLKKAK